MSKLMANAARLTRTRGNGKGDAANAVDRPTEIVGAAARLFMNNGFAATSIDNVAELLGCTKGLIYYHFANKSDLFLAVHRAALEYNLETLRPLSAKRGRAVAKLRTMAETHAMLIITRLPFQRVLALGLEMQALGPVTPDQRRAMTAIQRMQEQYEMLFAEVIQQGIREKTFRKADASRMAKPVLGALNSLTMWYKPRAGETMRTRHRLAADMAEFAVRGLSA